MYEKKNQNILLSQIWHIYKQFTNWGLYQIAGDIVYKQAKYGFVVIHLDLDFSSWQLLV